MLLRNRIVQFILLFMLKILVQLVNLGGKCKYGMIDGSQSQSIIRKYCFDVQRCLLCSQKVLSDSSECFSGGA